MKLKLLNFYEMTVLTMALISFYVCYIVVLTTESTISSVKRKEGNFHELELRLKGPVDQEGVDLVRYLLDHILIPPAIESYNLSNVPSYKKAKHGYNWILIHRWLKILFSNHHNGFFVEAGALDGEFLSNTLWLEQNLNWTGLLVEPEAQSYRNMVWKRRKAWLSHSCLSNKNYPKSVTMVSSRRVKHSSVPPWVVWGASYQKSYSNLTESKFYANFYKLTDSVYYNIQCYPLYSMLLALNVSVIDFLSLDVQGAEMDIFNTIPLDKIVIRSIVVEDNKSETNLKLIKHFNNLGFDLFAANSGGPDYFFVNRDDSKLMKLANELIMGQGLIDKGIHFKRPDIPFGEH